MENKNIIGTNFIITNRDLINEFGINVAVKSYKMTLIIRDF